MDASVEMGLGHLRRSMALAEALRQRGASVEFVTRDLGIDTARLLEADGYAPVTLPKPHRGFSSAPDAPAHAAWAGVPQELDADQTSAAVREADWVVVDHYAFDRRWHETVARETGARICAIDDLADRELRAALVIDHNWAPDHRARYRKLIQPESRLLAGPRFALLGRRYSTAAPYEFCSDVRTLGIFMGGADAGQVSSLVLRACREVAGFRGLVEVVTTSANPHLKKLADLCSRWPSTLLRIDLPDLVEFFGRHDLQLGAGGGATWERCCLGAPTLALKCADNQVTVIDALAGLGVVRTVPEVSLNCVGNAVAALLADVEGRHSLSVKSRALVDGRGCERAALALLADQVVLRAAMAEDAELVHDWRNDPRTRRYFHDSSEVPLEDHRQWWSRSLGDEDRLLMIACCAGRPVGSLRFDRCATAARVSIFVDPDLTGLGLGLGMLHAGQELARSHPWRLERLEAEVLPDNRASRSIFESAGFERTGAVSWQWTVGRRGRSPRPE